MEMGNKNQKTNNGELNGEPYSLDHPELDQTYQNPNY